jgi:hypothetical protein
VHSALGIAFAAPAASRRAKWLRGGSCGMKKKTRPRTTAVDSGACERQVRVFFGGGLRCLACKKNGEPVNRTGSPAALQRHYLDISI